MTRASAIQPATPRRLAFLAIGLVLFYVSGLPTALHFAIAHAAPVSLVNSTEHDHERESPVSPADEHRRTCEAWDFTTGGLSEAPAPTLTPVAPPPARCHAAITPRASTGVFAPDTSRPRGPPTPI